MKVRRYRLYGEIELALETVMNLARGRRHTARGAPGGAVEADLWGHHVELCRSPRCVGWPAGKPCEPGSPRHGGLDARDRHIDEH